MTGVAPEVSITSGCSSCLPSVFLIRASLLLPGQRLSGSSASGGLHPGTLGATAGVDASDPAWVCGARVSDSILTGGQGCDSQTCTTITHVFDSATGAGTGLLELSGSTLDFHVGISSATFTPAICPTPIFEFSDVVYSGTATVNTVGSTHTITSGTALISGTGGDVICPTPFTTSALDVSGSCEGAGATLSCVLSFLLTDPAFEVDGQQYYFVHTVTASGSPVAVPALGPLGIAILLGALGATAYWILRDSGSVS